MAQPQTFQLGPTSSFTAAQRRELNALLLRMSAAIPNVLSGGLADRPDPGTLNRLYVQTDAAGPHLYLDTGFAWFTIV